MHPVAPRTDPVPGRMLGLRNRKAPEMPPNPIRYALCLLLAACTQAPPPSGDPPSRSSQRASQPPASQTAEPDAAVPAAAAANVAPVPQQESPARDDTRSANAQPGPVRRLDPEAARAAVRGIAGVRSVVWVDDGNLLALVARNDQRTHAMIDGICSRLEALGDVSAVVVNLQNAAARNRDEMDILSRPCRSPAGDPAAPPVGRQVETLPPDVRAQYRAGKAALEAQRTYRQTKGDKAAMEAIPEI